MIHWDYEGATARTGLNIGWIRGPRVRIRAGNWLLYCRLRLRNPSTMFQCFLTHVDGRERGFQWGGH